MKKFCQSCGMPLVMNGLDVRGTEKDTNKSDLYCQYCYENGAFIDPKITFEQMKEKGIATINEGDGSTASKAIMKLSYPIQLKQFDRWKNK
ncbi:hypothetical protein PWEIH_12850 [Listeria weihenstephanensis FSL R9-0317]|uniref:Putative zinc ribbon domain-containing protein n=1 Tax=Listeria weihenstephanensis TaxID=1006155 RepID=A0A1S7FU35_9LIST|nr:zinc ribbon domain-containing protein [Listeria weihenstephanensis]AQY50961.1 hypothetical protein UE46_07845 [Listeria weihenstephanensis]EUJ36370.1 hypothetical protein PWEIH_12850 [Listeria weihenstephanensis FSL R9-0317]MBC1499903.1 hypothetical protein [Listeria weihenstephanensis]